jgi:hypothetical protein
MSDLQIKIAKTLIVTLVGITIYQSFTIRRLANALNIGERQFDKLHDAADYLLEVINENDIELTEFDLIALTSITEGK